MEQITVPQFLDVEDKIIGPITVRQFIEMMVGGMLIFIFYKLFDFSLFAVSGLLVMGIVLVVAFVRINGQPFHYFILNFFATLKNPKLKIWKNEVRNSDLKMALKLPPRQPLASVPLLPKSVTTSKLSELALIVDTGGVYRGEEGGL